MPSTRLSALPAFLPASLPSARYAGPTADRVAMPLGGLGTGCVLLQANGGLSGWSIRHRPDLLCEPIVFASLAATGKQPWARVLQSQVPDWRIMLNRSGTAWAGGGQGGGGHHYGLPCFAHSSARGAFPCLEVALTDPALPVSVTLSGWSPFVPGDAEATSLPVAVLEYAIANTGTTRLDLTFGFHAANFLGGDGKGPTPNATTRRISQGFALEGRNPVPAPAERTAPAANTACGPGGCGPEGCGPTGPDASLAITIDDEEVLVDAAWLRSGWFDTLTEVWKGVVTTTHRERPPHHDAHGERGASVTTRISLAPGETRTLRVQASWYAPTMSVGQDHAKTTPWSQGRFGSLDALVAHCRKEMPALRQRTAAFTEALHDGTVADVARDAVTANLAILKSPSLVRFADGRIWGWEGCHDNAGCCNGSCTHVYNYAQALSHLFPDLERGLRESEFIANQFATGEQRFRHQLPLGSDIGDKWGLPPAADGQLGGIIKLCREWRRSGDSGWLRRLWPQAKASLDFCIATWDPERNGHLAEPHHNTYDIEFWGEDPLCQSFYCAALTAAITMAKALGEDPGDWPRILGDARRVLREACFNGRYLRQRVRWKDLHAKDPSVGHIGHHVSPDALAIIETEGPKYQHGEGLLSDALLAVWLGRLAGLGAVIDEDLERAHLDAVVRFNSRESLRDHACPQRPSYAVADEGGLVICTWPDGGRPTMPFPYSDEVWTGIEYQVACHLITLGRVTDGLDIVRRCRARYDGRRRNPFDEYECGHFYIRALASYGLLEALSGARYDGVERVLHLHPPTTGDLTAFFAFGSAWGRVGVRAGQPFLELVEGDLPVDRIAYQPAAG